MFKWNFNVFIIHPIQSQGHLDQWVHAKLLQSCPTLCSSMVCSPPSSSVHGILQARILDWIAISFSKGIFATQGSNVCLLHWQADSLPLSHQGNPYSIHKKVLKLLTWDVCSLWLAVIFPCLITYFPSKKSIYILPPPFSEQFLRGIWEAAFQARVHSKVPK